MSLNAAKFQGYSFYRFWVIMGKATGGRVKLPSPTQIRIKKISALLHENNSKQKGDFCCFNGHNSFRTEHKLKSHEKVCKNKEFCGIVMPSEKK